MVNGSVDHRGGVDVVAEDLTPAASCPPRGRRLPAHRWSIYARWMDLGRPIAYQALEPGTKVLSSDGVEVGQVAHVLAVEDEDVFDGIVIAEHAGSGDHRFADADDIQEIHEHGVLLKLDRDSCAKLPQPSENPAVMSDDPAAPTSGELAARLRRAWDRLSGNY